MRFNGVDLLEIHSAVGRALEIPPGMAAREIATVETASGEIVTGLTSARDEYTVRVNLSARTYDEVMEARMRLAAWAASSGNTTALLEPTHAPGKAYDAIVKTVGRLEKRFGTVDVVFLLPKPVMYDITPQIRTAAGTKEITLQIGGTAPTEPIVRWTPSADANAPSLSIDGAVFFAMKGSVPAGKTLEITLETAAATLDGVHVEDRAVYTDMNPDIILTPGKHTVSASAQGTFSVRWHNRWQ